MLGCAAVWSTSLNRAIICPVATSAPATAAISRSTPDNGRFDGEDGFVRLDLEQRLAALDDLARLFEPGDDRDGRIDGRQVGHTQHEIHRSSLSTTSEQVDALENGVAHSQPTSHQDIFATAHS